MARHCRNFTESDVLFCERMLSQWVSYTDLRKVYRTRPRVMGFLYRLAQVFPVMEEQFGNKTFYKILQKSDYDKVEKQIWY